MNNELNNGNPQQTDKTENLRPSGSYNDLKVYQMACLIHDVTVAFVQHYIPVDSRTRDQMVQAARSGKQNIVEGSVDAATSAKLELNLYNVSRGSLEELKTDYLDYLRQHNAPVWGNNEPLSQQFTSMRIANEEELQKFIQQAENNFSCSVRLSIPVKAFLIANAMIMLINVTTFWLKKLILKKTEIFAEKGDFSETLHKLRNNRQREQRNGNQRQVTENGSTVNHR